MAAKFEIDPVIGQLPAGEQTKILRQLLNATDEVAREINKKLGGTVEKEIVTRIKVVDGQRIATRVETEVLSAVKQAQRSLEQLNKIDIGSVTNLRQQKNEAKQALDAIVKYETRAGGITGINQKWQEQADKVRDISRQLRAVDGSGFWERVKGDLGVGQLTSFFSGLTNIVTGFQSVSIIVGQVIGSINDLTDAVAKLQTFSLAFQAIGAGAGGAQQALNESSRIALNLGVSIQTVRAGFQQLTPVVLNSGGSINDVSNIIESLSSRFAAFGISGDRARRVTNGIIQAFGKGKLQAEELTQQIAEADPAFGTDFAKALGVSTAELLKLVKAGQITTDVLVRTIPKLSKSSLLYGNLGDSASDAADKLINGLGGSTVTIDQVRNKIASINQLSFESLATSFQPFLFALLKIEGLLADFFSQLSNSSAISSFASSLGGIVKALGGLLQALLTIASGFLTIIGPIASFVDGLLKLPGVANIVGAIILYKLINPLKLLGQGFGNALNAGGAFAQGVKKLSAPVQDLGANIQKTFADSNKVSAASSVAAAGFDKQAKSLSTLSAGYAFAGRAADAQRSKIANLQKTLSSETGVLSASQTLGIQNNIQVAERQLSRFTAAQEKAKEKYKEVFKEIGGGGQAVAATAGEAGKATTEYQRLTRTLGSLQNVNANASRSLAASGQELANVKARMNTLTQSLQNGTIGSVAYSQQMAALTARSGELTRNIERSGTIFASTGERIQATRDKLNVLASQAGQASGRIGGLGGAFKAFGATAAEEAKKAREAAQGLSAGFVAVNVALLAAGILQAAYSTATKRATEETRKGEAALLSYSETIKRLTDEQAKEVEPTGLEKAWKDYSTVATSYIQNIGKLASNTFNTLRGNIKDLEQADIINPFTAWLDGLDQSLIKVLQLKINIEAGIKSIDKQTESIKQATAGLEKFAASEKAQGAEGKIALTQEYKKLEDQIESTQAQFNSYKAQAEAARKEVDKTGSSTAQQRLKELEDRLKSTGAELQAAREEVIKTAKKLNLLSDKEISGAISTLGALGEEAKKLKESLENAVPGTTEFNQTAASISAIDLALEKLKKAAKNPVTINAGIDASTREKTVDLIRAQAKLREQEGKTDSDPVVIKSTREEIAKLERDLANLKELKIKVNAKSIDNAKTKIDLIESDIVELDINSPKLPRLIENLLKAKQEAEDINGKRITLTIQAIERGIGSNELNKSLKNTEELVTLLGERIATIDIRSPELPVLIEQLIDAQQTVQDLNNEKAIVTIEIIERRIEDGKSGVSIKTLDEQTQRYQQTIESLNFGDPRLPGLVEDLTESRERSEEIRSVLQQLTRTPYQVKIDLLGIEAELEKSRANLRLTGIDQGPEREAAALRAASAKDLNEAQEIYNKKVKEAEEARAKGIATEEKKNQLIKEAADVLETSTNNAKANLISAAEGFKRQLGDARSSLQGLILSKPQFFTREEIAANKAQIEEDFRQFELETGLKFTPAPGTSDEVLKQRLEFIETRKQAKQYEDAIKSLTEAIADLSAAITGVNGQSKKLQQPAIPKLSTEVPKYQATGEIEIQGEKYVLLLDKITGMTRTVTAEEAKRLLAAKELVKVQSQQQSEPTPTPTPKPTPTSTPTPTPTPTPDAATPQAKEYKNDIEAATDLLSKSITYSDQIAQNLIKAADSASRIAESFKSLDGLKVTIKIDQVPARWTGGPVASGQTYRVNEIGREGFMSASGRITEINRPRNAMWRAPSSGYVIPAHIWSETNTPTGTVSTRNPTASTSISNMQRLGGMLRAVVAGNNSNDIKQSIDRLANVQASQAIQLGKLSHAVNRFNEKDWNVKVDVTPRDNSNGYIGMINRAL